MSVDMLTGLSVYRLPLVLNAFAAKANMGNHRDYDLVSV